jgi:hypothetical protein
VDHRYSLLNQNESVSEQLIEEPVKGVENLVHLLCHLSERAARLYPGKSRLGNPPVRFDEGEGSVIGPSLLYFNPMGYQDDVEKRC